MTDEATEGQHETALDRAAEQVLARNPDVPSPLDQRALERLAQVVADPSGESWMEAAGLLDTDSCGYPVAGGLFDVRSDLAALSAARDPGSQSKVMDRLLREWADDYVLTGRARLDRPWTMYVTDPPRS